MNITGTSSYIKIEYQNKIIKVQGEMLVGGFVAYKNTMISWEPPHDKEMFHPEMRDEIIKEVLKFCETNDFKIEFE